MKNTKKGFTLIELLVVIAIIGLLATLSVVALNNARERARDSRRVSDIKQIQTALELYFNANDHYPKEGTWAGGTETPTEWITMTQLGNVADMDDFLNPVPDSPTPGDGVCTYVDDGTPKQAHEVSGDTYGTSYSYTATANGDEYRLYYCLGSEEQQIATPFTIGDL